MREPAPVRRINSNEGFQSCGCNCIVKWHHWLHTPCRRNNNHPEEEEKWNNTNMYALSKALRFLEGLIVPGKECSGFFGSRSKRCCCRLWKNRLRLKRTWSYNRDCHRSIGRNSHFCGLRVTPSVEICSHTIRKILKNWNILMSFLKY